MDTWEGKLAERFTYKKGAGKQVRLPDWRYKNVKRVQNSTSKKHCSTCAGCSAVKCWNGHPEAHEWCMRHYRMAERQPYE
jgi:hypothetical protein